MTLRWKKAKAPQIGDQRTVTKFLLLPTCFDGEWRWLGRESIAQEYREYFGICPDMPGGGCVVVGWVDVRWAA